MNKILFVLILLMTFVIGCQGNIPVKVENKIQLVPVTITHPSVTVTQETTVTKYTQTLNRFENYAELRAWLDGIYLEMREAKQADWNCVDCSWWLIERAQADGYLMVYHGILAEAYNTCFTNLQLDGAHAITATYINGHTYLIEPQNFEVFPDYEVE